MSCKTFLSRKQRREEEKFSISNEQESRLPSTTAQKECASSEYIRPILIDFFLLNEAI